MKKQIRLVGVVVMLAFGAVAFTGCGEAEVTVTDNTEAVEGGEESTEETTEEAEEEAPLSESKMYQCPDNCQNGPAFFEPGACKACGKEMVEI